MNGIIPSLHPAVIFADVFMSKSLSLPGGDEKKDKWKYNVGRIFSTTDIVLVNHKNPLDGLL